MVVLIMVVPQINVLWKQRLMQQPDMLLCCSPCGDEDAVKHCGTNVAFYVASELIVAVVFLGLAFFLDFQLLAPGYWGQTCETTRHLVPSSLAANDDNNDDSDDDGIDGDDLTRHLHCNSQHKMKEQGCTTPSSWSKIKKY